jgi:hypothetical protein
MYSVKIGILSITPKGCKVWSTYWTATDFNEDEEDMVKRIKVETQENTQDKIAHVVVLEEDEYYDEGNFQCGSCDMCFNKFDEEVGDNCCPYCGASNHTVLGVSLRDDSGVGSTIELYYKSFSGIVVEKKIFDDGSISTLEYPLGEFNKRAYGEKGDEFLKSIGEDPDEY